MIEPRTALPKELSWRLMDELSPPEHQPWLLCVNLWDEVARTSGRDHRAGTYTSSVNMQSQKRRYAIAPSRSAAMRWAERWAVAHLPRLLLEIAANEEARRKARGR